MLPKYHILFGFLFTYIIYWVSSITIFQASLIFFASVLIDFDHYLWWVKRKNTWSLKKSYFFHKNLHNRKKPIMMIFHTIEFLLIVGILSLYFNFFIFILIGMIFHSLVDIIYFYHEKMMYVREFSLIRYLILKKKYPKKYL